VLRRRLEFRDAFALAPETVHVETVRVGYARQARVKAAAELLEENRRLRAALALTSTPERVSAVAQRKRLAPARPGQGQYVEVTPP
jgi:hypothetical protein